MPPSAARFIAASRNRAPADEPIDTVGHPARTWAILGSPDGAAASIERHPTPPTYAPTSLPAPARRTAPGGTPTTRLKARLKAASER